MDFKISTAEHGTFNITVRRQGRDAVIHNNVSAELLLLDINELIKHRERGIY